MRGSFASRDRTRCRRDSPNFVTEVVVGGTTAPAAATCTPACASGQVCVNGACVGTGRLRFTLTWDTPGDMDLRVLTPAGDEIYYGNRSGGQGTLDRDDTRGTGPENVFWEGAPPSGRYLVCANAYRIGGPTRFELTVDQGGSARALHGTRTSSGSRRCAADSPDLVTEIVVP